MILGLITKKMYQMKKIKIEWIDDESWKKVTEPEIDAAAVVAKAKAHKLSTKARVIFTMST